MLQQIDSFTIANSPIRPPGTRKVCPQRILNTPLPCSPLTPLRGTPPQKNSPSNTKNPLFMGLLVILHPRKSCTKMGSFLHFTSFFGSLPPPHTVCSGKSFVPPVFQNCPSTLSFHLSFHLPFFANFTPWERNTDFSRPTVF